MNIVEALKLSDVIKRHNWEGSIKYMVYADHFSFTKEDLTSNDWEPVLPEKKTVTKKFYQAVLFDNKLNNHFISDIIFENPGKAEEYAERINYKLARFLSENPIEVEVEE